MQYETYLHAKLLSHSLQPVDEIFLCNVIVTVAVFEGQVEFVVLVELFPTVLVQAMTKLLATKSVNVNRNVFGQFSGETESVVACVTM